jgi:hypothetical protein
MIFLLLTPSTKNDKNILIFSDTAGEKNERESILKVYFTFGITKK